VMDDNVSPEAYWPCFQTIVARLPWSADPRRSAWRMSTARRLA